MSEEFDTVREEMRIKESRYYVSLAFIGVMLLILSSTLVIRDCTRQPRECVAQVKLTYSDYTLECPGGQVSVISQGSDKFEVCQCPSPMHRDGGTE